MRQNEIIETFIRATGADIRYFGHPAGYCQDADYIRMPPRAAFPDDETFFGVLAHELIHWTNHRKRLARDFGRTAFGEKVIKKKKLLRRSVPLTYAPN